MVSAEVWIIVICTAYACAEIINHLRITRTLLRMVILPFSLLELFSKRLFRKIFPPRFPIAGRCHMCGRCCLTIIGNPPNFIRRIRLFTSLYMVWHSVLHDFEAYARGPEGEIVFRCRLLGQDHICRAYWLRPAICRDFPYQYWFEEPRFIEGCGFHTGTPQIVEKK